MLLDDNSHIRENLCNPDINVVVQTLQKIENMVETSAELHHILDFSEHILRAMDSKSLDPEMFHKLTLQFQDKGCHHSATVGLWMIATLAALQDPIVLRLTVLNLSDCPLEYLPATFGSFTQLQQLDLSDNALNVLPESFGSLSQLQHLNLSNNNLEQLPDSFCLLSQLQYLSGDRKH